MESVRCNTLHCDEIPPDFVAFHRNIRYAEPLFLLLLQIIISYFMGRTKKFFAHKQAFSYVSGGMRGKSVAKKN